MRNYRRFNSLRSLLSLVTAFIFFLNTSFSYAQIAQNPVAPVSGASQNLNRLNFVDQINIPENLGSIQEVHRGGERAVVYVQDAHAQLHAQKNIYQILDHLKKEYGVDTVFMEGAPAGKISPDLLQFFKDPQLNQKVAEHLLEDGAIGGPELYLLNSKGAVQAFGTETLKLYHENLDIFRQVYQSRFASEKFLEEIKIRIVSIGTKIFNPALNDFLKNWLVFQDEKESVLGHLNILHDVALTQLKIDLNDPVHQFEYPQLARFFALKELQVKIKKSQNPEQEKGEIEKLKKWIAGNGKDAGGAPLLQGFIEKPGVSFPHASGGNLFLKHSPLQQTNADPRPKASAKVGGSDALFGGLTGMTESSDIQLNSVLDSILNASEDSKIASKIDVRTLLEDFYRLAEPKGFSFKDYPELNRRFGQMILTNELESESLFEEVETLTGKILSGLTQTPAEKELIVILKDYYSLKKLFALELTRDEYETLSGRQDSLLPSVMYQSLAKLGAAKGNAELESELIQFNELFKAASRFYQVSQDRESIIFQNLLETMKKENKTKAVLITGGFHSKKLMALMRTYQLSYVSVTPKINVIESNEKYLTQILLTPVAKSHVPPASIGKEPISGLSPEIRNFQLTGLANAIHSEIPTATFNENAVAFVGPAFKSHGIKSEDVLGMGSHTLSSELEVSSSGLGQAAQLETLNSKPGTQLRAEARGDENSLKSLSIRSEQESLRGKEDRARAEARVEIPNIAVLGINRTGLQMAKYYGALVNQSQEAGQNRKITIYDPHEDSIKTFRAEVDQNESLERSASDQLFNVIKNNDLIILNAALRSTDRPEVFRRNFHDMVKTIAGTLKNLRDAGHQKKKYFVVRTVVPFGIRKASESAFLKNIFELAGATNFEIIYQPIFVRGDPNVDDFDKEQILLGTFDGRTSDGVRILQEMYGKTRRVRVTPVREAEIAHYFIARYKARKLSHYSQFQTYVREVGGDINAVSVGSGLDGRIGTYYTKAGTGFGSSLRRIMLFLLQWLDERIAEIPEERQTDRELFKKHREMTLSILRVNDVQRERLLNLIDDVLKQYFQTSLATKRVAVLGVTNRPGSKSVSQSIAVETIKTLAESGVSEVLVYDPHLDAASFERLTQKLYEDKPDIKAHFKITHASSVEKALQGVDLAVVGTPHPEIMDIPPQQMADLLKDRPLFDGWNIYGIQPDGTAVHSLGEVKSAHVTLEDGAESYLNYISIGRKALGSKFGRPNIFETKVLGEMPAEKLSEQITKRLGDRLRKQLHVAVFGTGYVGLVSLAEFALLGHIATGIDIDKEKIGKASRGEEVIYEAGLQPLLDQFRGKTLQFVTFDKMEQVVRENELFYVAVGTPSAASGAIDLKYVTGVADNIGSVVAKIKQENGGQVPAEQLKTIVIKSTVTANVFEEISSLLSEKYDLELGVDYALASNPEFLKEGTAIEDTEKADRFVFGADERMPDDVIQRAHDLLLNLYLPRIQWIEEQRALGGEAAQGIPDTKVVLTDAISAPLIKYAANAFLALDISAANLDALLAKSLGASWKIISQIIRENAYISSKAFTEAGCGYGGSCFPKDVNAVRWDTGKYGDNTLLAETVDVNDWIKQEAFPRLVVETILGRSWNREAYPKPLDKMQVGIWGLAFKPQTDDVRESPALDLIDVMVQLGARVVATDPLPMARDNFERTFALRHGNRLVKSLIDELSLKDEAEKLEMVLNEPNTTLVSDITKWFGSQAVGRIQQDLDQLRQNGAWQRLISRIKQGEEKEHSLMMLFGAKAYRSLIQSGRIQIVSSPEESAMKSDALVLVTEWDEYKQADMDEIGKMMDRKVFVAGRRAFNADDMKFDGWTYGSFIEQDVQQPARAEARNFGDNSKDISMESAQVFLRGKGNRARAEARADEDDDYGVWGAVIGGVLTGGLSGVITGWLIGSQIEKGYDTAGQVTWPGSDVSIFPSHLLKESDEAEELTPEVLREREIRVRRKNAEDLASLINRIWDQLLSAEIKGDDILASFYEGVDGGAFSRATEIRSVLETLIKGIHGVKIAFRTREAFDPDFAFDSHEIELHLTVRAIIFATLVSVRGRRAIVSEIKKRLCQMSNNVTTDYPDLAETLKPLQVQIEAGESPRESRSEARAENETAGETPKEIDPLLPVLSDYAARRDALAAKRRQEITPLPESLDMTLVNAVGGGHDELVSSIMSNQELVQQLVATGIWGSKDQLRDALNNVAFGQPNDATIMSVRQVISTMRSRLKDSHVSLVVANILMDRRLKAPQFMEITDELLRAEDPALAENLEGLLKGSPDIQEKAFKWLFDRLIREAELSRTDPARKDRHLLTASIILKQFNVVLSNTDEEKWLGLQIHMIMRFASQIADESKQNQKPFMSALLVFYPNVSRDFLLAVDTNFGKVFHLKDVEKSDGVMKQYGGFENYAQAIETILSFAVIAWPDEFFEYFQSRFPYGTKIMQAQYLNSMKYGIHVRDEKNKPTEAIHEDRLQFLLENIVNLSDEKYSFIQSRLNDVMDFIPNQMIDYLLSDRRYQGLPDEKRTFLIEFILRVSVGVQIEGGRMKVLPLVMHEIRKESNRDIKAKILFGDYFSDEFLATLSPEDAKALREAIIDGYLEFKRNDLLNKNLIRIMKLFGLVSIQEAFHSYDQNISIKTNYEKAIASLHLAAAVASVYDAKGDKRNLEIVGGYLRKVAELAQNASVAKQEALADYYRTREDLSKLHKEIEGLETQTKTATMTAESVNAKVDKLREEEDRLIEKRRRLSTEQDDLVEQIKAAYVDQARLQTEIKKFPAGEQLLARFAARLTKLPKEEAPQGEGDLLDHYYRRQRSQEGVQPATDLNQLAIQLRASIASVSDMEKRRVEVGSAISGIDVRMRRMEPEKKEAIKEQTKIGESFNQIKRKQKDLQTNINNIEKTTLPIMLEQVGKTRRKTSDYHAALRLFAAGPYVTAELAKETSETLKPGEKEAPDGHLLVTRLGMAINPKFSGILDQEEIKKQLADHLRYQAERGLFKEEVLEEVRFLTLLAADGRLIPENAEDVLYRVMWDLLRERRYQPDTIAQMGKLAKRLQVFKDAQKKTTKRVAEEIETVTGIGANLGPGIADFLKFKFGDNKELVDGILFVFILTAMATSVDQAIESLFYMLAGEGGMFFVKPAEPAIEKPESLAEAIEQRYRTYYNSIHFLKTKVFEITEETFKLEEGFGWDKEANNEALYYFTALFNSENVTAKVSRGAEKILWLLAFEDWLKEGMEKEEKKNPQQAGKEKEEKPRLAFDEFAVFANIQTYLSAAPAISAQSVQAAVGRLPEGHVGKHNSLILFMLSYRFAKKMIAAVDRIRVEQLRMSLPILEKMLSILDPTLVYQDKEDKNERVNISELVKSAIRVVKEKLKIIQPEQLSGRALPPGRDRFALDRPTPVRPSSPRQLPGGESARSEGRLNINNGKVGMDQGAQESLSGQGDKTRAEVRTAVDRHRYNVKDWDSARRFVTVVNVVSRIQTQWERGDESARDKIEASIIDNLHLFDVLAFGSGFNEGVYGRSLYDGPAWKHSNEPLPDHFSGIIFGRAGWMVVVGHELRKAKAIETPHRMIVYHSSRVRYREKEGYPVTGAVAGYLMGGPIGAAVGYLVGDDMGETYSKRTHYLTLDHATEQEIRGLYKNPWGTRFRWLSYDELVELVNFRTDDDLKELDGLMSAIFGSLGDGFLKEGVHSKDVLLAFGDSIEYYAKKRIADLIQQRNFNELRKRIDQARALVRENTPLYENLLRARSYLPSLHLGRQQRRSEARSPESEDPKNAKTGQELADKLWWGFPKDSIEAIKAHAIAEKHELGARDAAVALSVAARVENATQYLHVFTTLAARFPHSDISDWASAKIIRVLEGKGILPRRSEARSTSLVPSYAGIKQESAPAKPLGQEEQRRSRAEARSPKKAYGRASLNLEKSGDMEDLIIAIGRIASTSVNSSFRRFSFVVDVPLRKVAAELDMDSQILEKVVGKNWEILITALRQDKNREWFRRVNEEEGIQLEHQAGGTVAESGPAESELPRKRGRPPAVTGKTAQEVTLPSKASQPPAKSVGKPGQSVKHRRTRSEIRAGISDFQSNVHVIEDGADFRIEADEANQKFWLLDKKHGSVMSADLADGNTVKSMRIGMSEGNPGRELFYMSKDGKLGGHPTHFPFAGRQETFTDSKGVTHELHTIPGLRVVNGIALHGMVRNKLWNFVKSGIDQNGAYVEASLNTEDHPEISEHFGRMTIRIVHRLNGNRLDTDIEVEAHEALKDGAVEELLYYLGFHPWNEIPVDAEQRAKVEWSVEGVSHQWKVDPATSAVTGEWTEVGADHPYHLDQLKPIGNDPHYAVLYSDSAAPKAKVVLPDGLALDFQAEADDPGFHNVVLWAPAPGKAPLDEGKAVISVQHHTAPPNALVIRDKNSAAMPNRTKSGNKWNGRWFMVAAQNPAGKQIAFDVTNIREGDFVIIPNAFGLSERFLVNRLYGVAEQRGVVSLGMESINANGEKVAGEHGVYIAKELSEKKAYVIRPARAEARAEQIVKIFADASDTLMLPPEGLDKFPSHEEKLRTVVEARTADETLKQTFISEAAAGYAEFQEKRRNNNIPIGDRYLMWLRPFQNAKLSKSDIATLVKDWRLNGNFLEAVKIIREKLGLGTDETIHITIVSGALVDLNEAFINRADVKPLLDELNIKFDIEGVKLGWDDSGYFDGTVTAQGKMFYAQAKEFPKDAIVIGDNLMEKYGFSGPDAPAAFANVQSFNKDAVTKVVSQKITEVQVRSEARTDMSAPLKLGDQIPGTDFILGVDNSDSAIESLRRWRDYGKVVANMRPQELSYAGFLGRDQDFVDVLLQDARTLRRLGFPGETLSAWLENFIKQYPPQREEISFNGQRLRIEGSRTRGWQNPPLPGPIRNSSDDIRITNLGNGSQILITNMHPDLIRVWGFFEGNTEYRASPEDIIKVFQPSLLNRSEARTTDVITELRQVISAYNNASPKKTDEPVIQLTSVGEKRKSQLSVAVEMLLQHVTAGMTNPLVPAIIAQHKKEKRQLWDPFILGLLAATRPNEDLADLESNITDNLELIMRQIKSVSEYGVNPYVVNLLTLIALSTHQSAHPFIQQYQSMLQELVQLGFDEDSEKTETAAALLVIASHFVKQDLIQGFSDFHEQVKADGSNVLSSAILYLCQFTSLAPKPGEIMKVYNEAIRWGAPYPEWEVRAVLVLAAYLSMNEPSQRSEARQTASDRIITVFRDTREKLQGALAELQENLNTEILQRLQTEDNETYAVLTDSQDKIKQGLVGIDMILRRPNMTAVFSGLQDIIEVLSEAQRQILITLLFSQRKGIQELVDATNTADNFVAQAIDELEKLREPAVVGEVQGERSEARINEISKLGINQSVQVSLSGQSEKTRAEAREVDSATLAQAETTLKELGANFDPRFGYQLWELNQKPVKEWSDEDWAKFEAVKESARKAADWMNGMIKKLPYYEALKGYPSRLFSMEGVVSAVEKGLGYRLDGSFAGGLGILFGEWIRAIAYLGGVTTLEKNSEAPEFLVYIPDYSAGVATVVQGGFGFSKRAYFQGKRPQDFGIDFYKDPEAAEKPLEVVVPVLREGQTIEVKVRFRLVKIGGIQLIMPTTDFRGTDEVEAERHNPYTGELLKALDVQTSWPEREEILEKLYVDEAGSHRRFEQEWVFGIANYLFEQKLGIPRGPIHLNETATFPYVLGVIRGYMEEGLSFGEAIERTGAQTIFFTHTLEAAGIDHFDDKRVRIGDYIRSFFKQSRMENVSDQADRVSEWLIHGKKSDRGVDLPVFGEPYDHGKLSPIRFVAQLAGRFGGSIVAVSQLNALKAGELLRDQNILSEEELRRNPVIGITNGVDHQFWMVPEIQEAIKLKEADMAARDLEAILDPQEPRVKELFEKIHPEGVALPASLTSDNQPRFSDEQMKEIDIKYKTLAIQAVRKVVADQYSGEMKLIETKQRKAARGVGDHMLDNKEISRLKVLRTRMARWTGIYADEGAKTPEEWVEKADGLTVNKQIAYFEKLNGAELKHLLNPNLMLGVWARRIVEYKRSLHVIFGKHLPDVERWIGGRILNEGEIIRLIEEFDRRGAFEPFLDLVGNRDHPIQLIFSGVPFGGEGISNIAVIHYVIEYLSAKRAGRADIQDRVVFLERYDERLSQFLVRAADLWINSPKNPREASGTSGMKMSNGVNIFSSASGDGWASALINDVTGFVRSIPHVNHEFPPLGNENAMRGWRGHDSRPEDMKRMESTEAYYLRVEAENLYEMFDKARQLFYARDERGISKDWLRFVRRAVYSTTLLFDIRNEFTGRFIPSFVEGIPGGRETGILDLHVKAAQNIEKAKVARAEARNELSSKLEVQSLKLGKKGKLGTLNSQLGTQLRAEARLAETPPSLELEIGVRAAVARYPARKFIGTRLIGFDSPDLREKLLAGLESALFPNVYAGQSSLSLSEQAKENMLKQKGVTPKSLAAVENILAVKSGQFGVSYAFISKAVSQEALVKMISELAPVIHNHPNKMIAIAYEGEWNHVLGKEVLDQFKGRIAVFSGVSNYSGFVEGLVSGDLVNLSDLAQAKTFTAAAKSIYQLAGGAKRYSPPVRLRTAEVIGRSALFTNRLSNIWKQFSRLENVSVSEIDMVTAELLFSLMTVGETTLETILKAISDAALLKVTPLDLMQQKFGLEFNPNEFAFVLSIVQTLQAYQQTAVSA